jgi:hypothetical protein
MNPFLAQQLLDQHVRELRTKASEARLHAQPSARGSKQARPGPGNSVRYRAGWTLVAIGLRLAGPANAGLSH